MCVRDCLSIYILLGGLSLILLLLLPPDCWVIKMYIESTYDHTRKNGILKSLLNNKLRKNTIIPFKRTRKNVVKNKFNQGVD